MTNVQGAPSPIDHIGLEVRNGILQVGLRLQELQRGAHPCPTIAGYTQSSGWVSPDGLEPQRGDGGAAPANGCTLRSTQDGRTNGQVAICRMASR